MISFFGIELFLKLLDLGVVLGSPGLDRPQSGSPQAGKAWQEKGGSHQGADFDCQLFDVPKVGAEPRRLARQTAQAEGRQLPKKGSKLPQAGE